MPPLTWVLPPRHPGLGQVLGLGHCPREGLRLVDIAGERAAHLVRPKAAVRLTGLTGINALSGVIRPADRHGGALSGQGPAAGQADQAVGAVKGDGGAGFRPGRAKIQLVREGVKLIAQKVRRLAEDAVVGGARTAGGQIPILGRRDNGTFGRQPRAAALAEDIVNQL